MERILIRVLIITSVCSLSLKHVFITPPRSWRSAQEHCRTFFTELSPLSSELEEQVFRESVGQGNWGWIGLYRNQSSPTGWTWSGGEHMTYNNWSYTSSSYNYLYYYYGYWSSGGWRIARGSQSYNFFCLNLIVVEAKASWEEVLEYCRENHTNITSLLSKTKSLLAQKGIQKAHITERVWIGLRYLHDRWLWVNGDHLEYEAWSQGGDQDHQFPLWKRCAALTKGGFWENWDCTDQLNFICV